MENAPPPEPLIAANAPGLPVPETPEGIVPGQVVPVETFQGDPRRVAGHPDNPDTVALQAYADQHSSGVSAQGGQSPPAAPGPNIVPPMPQ
jgi:hypothetical protein